MTVAQFTTIGHSNRSLDEFVTMLRDAQVQTVIDVRSFPRSRTNPVFNIDNLPDDLAQVQVIRDESSLLHWDAWLEAAGVAVPPAMTGPSFTDPLLAYEAALAGQGVLLVMDMLMVDALATGRLVRPFPVAVESEYAHWFVSAAGRRLRKPARLFRDWLEVEIAR